MLSLEEKDIEDAEILEVNNVEVVDKEDSNKNLNMESEFKSIRILDNVQIEFFTEDNENYWGNYDVLATAQSVQVPEAIQIGFSKDEINLVKNLEGNNLNSIEEVAAIISSDYNAVSDETFNDIGSFNGDIPVVELEVVTPTVTIEKVDETEESFKDIGGLCGDTPAIEPEIDTPSSEVNLNFKKAMIVNDKTVVNKDGNSSNSKHKLFKELQSLSSLEDT